MFLIVRTPKVFLCFFQTGILLGRKHLKNYTPSASSSSSFQFPCYMMFYEIFMHILALMQINGALHQWFLYFGIHPLMVKIEVVIFIEQLIVISAATTNEGLRMPRFCSVI